MGGGFLLCGWWMGDRWFKTHLRDVFSSGITPMFISQAIMKKVIFENYENSLFWVIFTVFLKLFSLCKNRLKIWFFIFRFFWLRVMRGRTNVLRRSFRTKRTFGEHWFNLSTFSAKKIEIWKIRFLAYFYIRKIALKYSKNHSK